MFVSWLDVLGQMIENTDMMTAKMGLFLHVHMGSKVSHDGRGQLAFTNCFFSSRRDPPKH